MPFRIRLRRHRRYNVLSKNCFVTRIRLLDNNVIECTLSVESTGQECLEAVAQRLELRETHYFGLWFQSKSQLQRWVELEKALKKQLDKFGNEPLLFFGVMFYVPNVSRLEQEVTRYQYYLQVKKEILDGRLQCTVEQGIRLAGLAVQADFGDFTQFQSQDFLREYVLFPVNWPHVEEVLEEWTQKVAEEHKSHCGMQPAEAELLYIKEVERLDGYGQESFAAKDNYTNDLYIGVSFIGVFAKHRNGRSIMLHRWKDIGNIGHNKSAITVEITSKDDTMMFHTEDMEMAKYIARLFTARHKFYKQNKICTEPAHSPVQIRRRPTWTGSSLRCPCFPVLSFYTDSIFHEDLYYKSETSLDRCPVDFAFRNGTVPNGSVYSTPSMNSLNHSQTFMQASPMSSSLSIPGSDVMRPDYIPSHRHSAIIAPSYRPTPDYEAVMRQKRHVMPPDCHSQSLRNLNISNAYAYRQPEALVYSQPEMRERAQYPGPYNPPVSYSRPVVPSTHVNPGCGPAAGQAAGTAISHTVSTPELANTKQQGAQGYNATHMLRNHLSRPPPPYPTFRPATSTPDLASHRHRCMGGSSPELVTRKVQLSVKTFKPDSSAVVHQSLQEVSEPLTAVKHHSALGKRPSLEVISSMVRGMEAMALKTLNAPLPRRNTLREQAAPPPVTPPAPPPEVPPQKAPEAPVPYQHKKTFSNATMLIHSSESEEEEESPDLDVQIPGLNEDISVQLQAALAKIPNKPPPEYPGPRKSASSSGLRHDRGRDRQSQTGTLTRADPTNLNGTLLGPSISEPDLTSVKERVRKEPVKERPVSEMFSIEDSIVESEIRLRTLEKQKMSVDSLKRPLMMAALNGLYVARMPVPENQQEDLTRVCSGTVLSCGEEWHYIATQGPLPNTCQDFWQMVWEQGVNVIAMVTAEEEGGRSKSHRYWPKLGSKHNSATHGKFKVTTKFRTDSGCYATTGLKVKHLLSGQERTVWHLQYTDWPDLGCPEYVQGFLSYLEEIQSVRRHTNSMLDTSRSLNPPIVVHCSAGVGRTGVVILTELMVSCVEHNEKVEIPMMLARLRQQRMLMVQTISQYKFVYQVLIQFLKNSRLI
uniref:Tyrosine-protein phosphatase non-receptor type n=1 Tax=Scleropages formosus TaxID=113540 RepID=A0A8C9VCA1_SCLFO